MPDDERSSVPFSVPLKPDEKKLLLWGLDAWVAPARMTDKLAAALGYDNALLLIEALPEIERRLNADEPMVQEDWIFVVCLLEIAFASRVFGTGWEWRLITGYTDVESIEILRDIQGLIPDMWPRDPWVDSRGDYITP